MFDIAENNMETLEDLEAEGVEVTANLVTDDPSQQPSSFALTGSIDREDVVDDWENDDDDAEDAVLDEEPLEDAGDHDSEDSTASPFG